MLALQTSFVGVPKEAFDTHEPLKQEFVAFRRPELVKVLLVARRRHFERR